MAQSLFVTALLHKVVYLLLQESDSSLLCWTIAIFWYLKINSPWLTMVNPWPIKYQHPLLRHFMPIGLQHIELVIVIILLNETFTLHDAHALLNFFLTNVPEISCQIIFLIILYHRLKILIEVHSDLRPFEQRLLLNRLWREIFFLLLLGHFRG